MKKIHLLLVLFTVFLFNTATAQIDTQYDFGKPFEIGKEERASFGKDNFSVMIAELIEDSRCPEGMNCIWEGQVKLRLTIQKKDKTYSKEITLRGGRSTTVQVDGYEIKLLSANVTKIMSLKQYTYTIKVLEKKASSE